MKRGMADGIKACGDSRSKYDHEEGTIHESQA